MLIYFLIHYKLFIKMINLLEKWEIYRQNPTHSTQGIPFIVINSRKQSMFCQPSHLLDRIVDLIYNIGYNSQLSHEFIRFLERDITQLKLHLIFKKLLPTLEPIPYFRLYCNIGKSSSNRNVARVREIWELTYKNFFAWLESLWRPPISLVAKHMVRKIYKWGNL